MIMEIYFVLFFFFVKKRDSYKVIFPNTLANLREPFYEFHDRFRACSRVK